MLLRTAKSCGPDASTPASSLRRHVGPTGGRQASIRKRRGETSPVTGESTKEAVKTIACGNAGCSGATVVTTLVCYLHIAREAAGAAGHPHSPRPLLGENFIHDSGASRRGIAKLRLRNSLNKAAAYWIPRRSLSSGSPKARPGGGV